MTTTITGSGITFTDDVFWNGAGGTLYPDNSSSTGTTNYAIGYLALANTVYVADTGVFLGNPASGGVQYQLNLTTKKWNNTSGYATNPVINTAYSASSYFGSQNFYTWGNTQCAGTWKSRGQAINVGLNQNYGNFVLLERVA